MGVINNVAAAAIRIRVFIFSLLFELKRFAPVWRNSNAKISSLALHRDEALSESLSQRLAIDLVNPDAAHLRTHSRKVDIVNPAVVAPHVDASGSAIAAAALLRPNVKGRKRKILSVHCHVEFHVF